jgi:hypothetical protein
MVYVSHSFTLAISHFTRVPDRCPADGAQRCISRPGWAQSWLDWSEPLRQPIEALRLVHAYHLFGHITRQRIEPEFEVDTGDGFQPLAMRYKPGPVDRPPPFVAPHQPRVDFRLWFYGLGFRRGVPRFVSTLLERLCTDPEAIRDLFTSLPEKPARYVRIRFWRYRFTSVEERAQSGNWWSRQELATTTPSRCQPMRDRLDLRRLP